MSQFNVRTVFLLLAAGCAGAAEPPVVAPAPSVECNGSIALCETRYDRAVYLTAHNAMSHAESFWFAPNQNYPIERQLADGVRGISLDLHRNPDNPDEPLLCHGNCAGGSRLLGAELQVVRRFLDANPREVVTLLYEGTIDDEPVAGTFEMAGLAPFAHAQPTDAAWPTLGRMIETGKRLVVFSQDTGGGRAWLHPMWSYTWDTPYAYERISEFDCSVGRGDAKNAIFQMNHFLTAPVAGRALAEQANTYAVLMERVKRCRNEVGRLPTFIWVDWYATGDAMRVVNELNNGG